MGLDWFVGVVFAIIFIGGVMVLSLERKSEAGSPGRHILGRAGVWVFGLGVVVLVAALFIPDAIPDVPRAGYGESIDLDAYRAQLQDAQNYARVSALANLIAHKAIAGGFLMWLAGRVIDAFRHPETY